MGGSVAGACASVTLQRAMPKPPDVHETLKRKLAEFAAARDWGQFHTPRNLAVCLSVEASELLELFMWTRDGDGPFPPGTGPPPEARVREEVGDVFLCLLNFARVSGIDLHEAATQKLEALGQKYPVSLSRGSAAKAPGLFTSTATATATATTTAKATATATTTNDGDR